MSGLSGQVGNRRGWPQVILFDLDGTLIDSAPDIAAAVNELLASHQLAPLPVAEIQPMIGNGVKTLVERAFESRGQIVAGGRLEQLHMMMMPIYARHLTRLTTLMPHAADTLRDIGAAGVKTGVVTNKPEAFTREILAFYDLAKHVDILLGGDSGPARKPAPDMLLHAIAAFGIAPKNALMIGDSAADADAARAAGIACILVRGGYSTKPLEELGATSVVESMAEVQATIETMTVPA